MSGCIYDNRFLVKPTKTAAAMMPNADREFPCEGARETPLVDHVDHKQFLRALIEKMYDELPAQKKRN